MRVLVLTNMYPHAADPSFGTFVYEQVRALRGLGVDMDVLFVNGRASRWQYLLGYPRLWRQLRHVRYDLIHAHYVFAGWIARAQGRLPVVQSFHGAGEMLGYQGRLCKRLAPLVDRVIVTSADHKARLAYAPARIIPCGVDLTLFTPRPRDEARRALGWDPATRTVLWLGDPRPEKRLDLVRGAFERLAQRRSDVDLKIVSRVPHDQVPTYMSAAHALILPSDAEGSPVVIKEAMACNLPIVGVDVGDVAQVIAGVAGCYLAERTVEDLADKLALALQHEHSAGRAAIQHLQTGAEAQAILALYRELVPEGAATAAG
ncbi:MAG: glycosyltransferase family 4 protein [Chloroflexi bacterium]|nr:glycosyltransferase family 4 protein [Chloroflexota bacterium]